MENKKIISLATYIISLIIMGLLVIIFMLVLFKTDKNNSNSPTTQENNQIIFSNDTNENELQNIVENEIEDNNTIEQSNTNKNILYTFESADNLAAKGYPRKLNIYKITADTLEFDYNGGYDLKKQTLDLKLSGTAKSTKENTYSYTTKIDGNEYEILLEFNEADNAVKLSDRYNSSGEYSEINLWNTSKTTVKSILSGISKKQSAIDWEEYPDDIDLKNMKWMFSTKSYSEVQERLNDYKNDKFYKEVRKTLYSLSKKYKEVYSCPFDIWGEFGLGDSGGWMDYTTNKKSKKYTDALLYKIAVVRQNYFFDEVNKNLNEDDYVDIWSKEMNKVENYSLEKKIKFQYNNLKKIKNLEWGDKKINYKDFYYKVGKIAIMNGNNESKASYKNNSRAKKIRVTVNNNKKYIFNLKDTNKVQIFDINYKQNTVKKPVEMKVEVLESYDGEKSKDVYISDLQFTMESNIPQGI